MSNKRESAERLDAGILFLYKDEKGLITGELQGAALELPPEIKERFERALAIPGPVLMACRERMDFLARKVKELERERDTLADFMNGVKKA